MKAVYEKHIPAFQNTTYAQRSALRRFGDERDKSLGRLFWIQAMVTIVPAVFVSQQFPGALEGMPVWMSYTLEWALILSWIAVVSYVFAVYVINPRRKRVLDPLSDEDLREIFERL